MNKSGVDMNLATIYCASIKFALDMDNDTTLTKAKFDTVYQSNKSLIEIYSKGLFITY